jgi:hypothetical protein
MLCSTDFIPIKVESPQSPSQEVGMGVNPVSILERVQQKESQPLPTGGQHFPVWSPSMMAHAHNFGDYRNENKSSGRGRLLKLVKRKGRHRREKLLWRGKKTYRRKRISLAIADW